MPLDVIMPALGMAQDTGRIVAWHKHPGDAVAKGDVLFEVETDKATMEVEAQSDGYLTDVTADAETDVPVGHVIAKISDSAESSSEANAKPPKPAASEDEALPKGKDVIMPTLGMAQDTGLLVTWHKAAGDAVAADDVLFEVETDKSTVEVNAGADGYLAAVLAEAGEEIPVGQTIAIITDAAPANPITRKAAAAALSAQPAAKPDPAPKATASPSPTAKGAPAKTQQPVGGRILASPKLRRLAHEQGLDLARLVAAGHPQPYHANDLETLKSLSSAPAPAPTEAQASCRLTAELATEGFTDFALWAATEAKLTDARALLAGFCAASKGAETAVAVTSFGDSTTYAASARLGAAQTTDAAPELRLRDLRFTPITTVDMGADDIPTLTLTRSGTGLRIALDYAQGTLGADEAITFLSNFAGRMEQPLRHLL